MNRQMCKINTSYIVMMFKGLIPVNVMLLYIHNSCTALPFMWVLLRLAPIIVVLSSSVHGQP